MPLSEGEVSWQVFLREGEPVVISADPKSGIVAPVDYDVASGPFTGASGSVTTGEGFLPGETWYGVVVSSSCPWLAVRVGGEAVEDDGGGDDTGPMDDTGPVDDDSDDSDVGDDGGEEEPAGCGCASGAVGGTGGWLLALGAVIVAGRRRR
jgi:MYXO-CTERM domain-containing protein